MSQFSVGNFLTHSAEKFCRGTFCVAENFWYRKMSRRRERGHHDFPSKIICLNTEKLRRGNPTFQKISGIAKFYG